jgi:hypothetical protein
VFVERRGLVGCRESTVAVCLTDPERLRGEEWDHLVEHGVVTADRRVVRGGKRKP